MTERAAENDFIASRLSLRCDILCWLLTANRMKVRDCGGLEYITGMPGPGPGHALTYVVLGFNLASWLTFQKVTA